MDRRIDVSAGMAVHPEFGDQVKPAIFLRETRGRISGVYNGIPGQGPGYVDNMHQESAQPCSPMSGTKRTPPWEARTIPFSVLVRVSSSWISRLPTGATSFPPGAS